MKRRSFTFFVIGTCLAGVLASPWVYGKKVPLRYASFLSQEELAIEEANLKSFHEKYPNIKVNLERVSGDYFSILLAQMAGGKAPDIFWMGDSCQDFAYRKLLLNIKPLINQDRSFDFSDFYPQVLGMYGHRGGLYGLPKDMSTLVFYYNKNLFEKAGLRNPGDYWKANDWDWDSLVSVGRKLTKDLDGNGTTDNYGVTMDLSWFNWMSFIWQNGGDVVTDDLSKPLLNTPEAIGGIQFITDLMYKHKVMPKLGGNDQLFRTGKIGLYMNGVWMRSAWRKIKDFSWDVAPLAKGKAGNTSTLLVGGLAVSAQTKHPKEAWTLLKFLTSPECQARRASMGQSQPSRKSVANSEAFLDTSKQPNSAKYFNDAISGGKLAPVTRKWDDIMAAFNDELGPVWTGKIGPAQGAANVASKLNNILARIRKEGK